MLSLYINLSSLIFLIYIVLKSSWNLNFLISSIWMSILSVIISYLSLGACSGPHQTQKNIKMLCLNVLIFLGTFVLNIIQVFVG